MPKEQKPTKTESMPEAEVTLRLAFWLLSRAGRESHADVSIDGAHVHIAAHEQVGRQIQERTVFDIRSFLAKNGWYPGNLKDDWRGTYTREGQSLRIQSVHGFDVQVSHGSKSIKAECKGGRLYPVRGRGAAAVLASAIGQAIVSSSNAQPPEELWVAVPDSPKFDEAAQRIKRSPAFGKTGIRIALVGKAAVRLLS